MLNRFSLMNRYLAHKFILISCNFSIEQKGAPRGSNFYIIFDVSEKRYFHQISGNYAKHIDNEKKKAGWVPVKCSPWVICQAYAWAFTSILLCKYWISGSRTCSVYSNCSHIVACNWNVGSNGFSARLLPSMICLTCSTHASRRKVFPSGQYDGFQWTGMQLEKHMSK